MNVYKKIYQYICKKICKILLDKSHASKPPIFCVRLHIWKHEYFKSLFPENDLYFLPFRLTEEDFYKKWAQKIKTDKRSKILLWGNTAPQFIESFLKKTPDVPLLKSEDGFIRSLGLGADHVLPLSVVIDKTGLYFDATKPSDLEEILNTYDFQSDVKLLKRAEAFRRQIVDLSISKYNHTGSTDIEKVYGPKTKKRILVVGQVEDDASIQYGCERKLLNNDLVVATRSENPDAHIIYKPHPDVMRGHREYLSHPADVQYISQVLEEDISISDALLTIDHVYTLTSLVGFEALLRGIGKVTTWGAPFYSNWGLTDDRQKVTRRSRKLTVNELVAGVYFLYPRYHEPVLRKRLTPEEALKRIVCLQGRDV